MILGMTTFTAVHVLLSVIGSRPAFALTQGVVLVFYLVTGFLAVRAFRPAAHPV